MISVVFLCLRMIISRFIHVAANGNSSFFLKKKWKLVTQSCVALCNPVDCSLPGSFVHGILQSRILEWVANSFSRGSSQPSDWTWVSCIAGRFFTVWATGKICYRKYSSVMGDEFHSGWEKRRQEIVPSRPMCKWVWPLGIWKQQTISHSAILTGISMSSRQKKIDRGLPWWFSG